MVPVSRPLSPAPEGFASDGFRPSAGLAAALRRHGAGCRCALHGRRLFGQALLAGGAGLAWPALAQDGVRVSDPSTLAKLVPAEDLERAAAQQYAQMLQEARQQRALAPDDHPQVIRLRAIADRLKPNILAPNLKSTPRAQQWKWEVNLIGSKELNAFCMPGGKIAFYYGILQQLQLTDDEVSMIMGHEIAHALREHARARMGKGAATRIGANVVSALLGLGNLGDAALSMGAQLLTLRFSREDESEADKIGLDLSARAGYDPRAGVSLWEKMAAASKGAPPQFMSTHPSGPTRIKDIQANLPDVQPLFARAPKPPQRFGPPKAS
ncbi:Zn-dependent protease with chaperone function [Piscinibacter sakaiensis]|uniref:Zn-dependent protease with chaperone function n=1 Tax=Piscinibacter sakaiensis TaxID=1547922 RepID=A0A0K8NYV2_PISS1|nr:Zn-dependent protease with chaperone function [Piscinibacter sakaiensis]